MGWHLECGGSDLRQHASQDLKAKVLLVVQTIGSSLDDTNLIVEALDKTQRGLIFGLAVSGDALPVTVYHAGKLLVGG